MTAAADIDAALGGRRSGAGWVAKCPSHDDRRPSLSIAEGKGGRVLVRCFAGCPQAAVIEALRARGLWPGAAESPRPRPVRRRAPDRDDARRTGAARRMWRQAQPVAGTVAQRYLHARGFDGEAPPSLRFLPSARHPASGRWPCLIAGVTRWPGRQVVAVQRTFLARDGTGKAPLTPARLSLGPCRGGAVRLGPLQPGEPLVLAEGVEDALVIMTATGLPAWATLGTAGLRAVVVPPPDRVREVVIAADADAPGLAAARALGQRLLREGHRVRLAVPPEGSNDFGDIIGKGLSDAA